MKKTRRVRRYLEIDVLTAALDRVRHVYDVFDSVAVMFSGGKDSLATLELCRQVALDERGLDHVDVVFRDEELIPQCVIDKVDEYRQKPWVRMLWFAVPLKSHKFVLGDTEGYVQWDPGREWVREKPTWAIQETNPPGMVFDQYSMDEYTAKHYRGNVAFMTGIRASESLIRFRASVNKLHENWINSCSAKNVKLCKPIFDWEEDDVFKFFWERGIQYCSIYDAQNVAQVNLRVSTPVHAESAKRFDKLKVVDPRLYQRVVDVFPDMTVQERYWSELDRGSALGTIDESTATLEDCYREAGKIHDPAMRALAMKRLNSVRHRMRESPDAYPARHVLQAIQNGAYKREIMPCKTRS